jgi:molybdate transport system substrate-binding protein
MTSGSRLAVGALVVLSVALTGCSSAQPGDRQAESGPALSGDITVFAAASLNEAFERMAAQFEAAHPGLRVVLSFGGSSVLAEQLLQGAPADVFASADRPTIRRVEDAGLVTGDAVFATNVLEIAVPPGNPARVATLEDLARPDLAVALCAADVPCGASARAAFSASGVTPRPDTLERDVKSVLTKVRMGEVDAGVVYRTDVLAAGGDVDGVPIPDAVNVTNEYPIASLADGAHRKVADAFVSFVLSDAGRAVLDEAGFGAP